MQVVYDLFTASKSPISETKDTIETKNAKDQFEVNFKRLQLELSQQDQLPLIQYPFFILMSLCQIDKIAFLNKLAQCNLFANVPLTCAVYITFEKSKEHVSFSVTANAKFQTSDPNVFQESYKNCITNGHVPLSTDNMVFIKCISPQVTGNMIFLDIPVPTPDKEVILNEIIQYHMSKKGALILSILPTVADVQTDYVFSFITKHKLEHKTFTLFTRPKIQTSVEELKKIASVIQTNSVFHIGFLGYFFDFIVFPGHETIVQLESQLRSLLHKQIQFQIVTVLVPSIEEALSHSEFYHIGLEDDYDISEDYDNNTVKMFIRENVVKQFAHCATEIHSGVLGQEIASDLNTLRTRLCEFDFKQFINQQPKKPLCKGCHMDVLSTRTVLAEIEQLLPSLFHHVPVYYQEVARRVIEHILEFFISMFKDFFMNVFVTSLSKLLYSVIQKDDFVKALIHAQEKLCWTMDEETQVEIQGGNVACIYHYPHQVSRDVFADVLPKYLFSILVTPLQESNQEWIQTITTNLTENATLFLQFSQSLHKMQCLKELHRLCAQLLS